MSLKVKAYKSAWKQRLVYNQCSTDACWVRGRLRLENKISDGILSHDWCWERIQNCYLIARLATCEVFKKLLCTCLYTEKCFHVKAHTGGTTALG